jgi:hypothetical protein
MISRSRLSGLLGRAVRGLRATRLGGALDERIDLRYLVERSIHERAAIDAFVAGGSRSTALVSVVTPAFGIGVADLEEFVTSLQRQTHARWELCLCIDGDEDGAVHAFFERMERKDPDRIRVVVHDGNRGIAAATRSALSLARGDVIAFVDADDVLHERALEVVADAFAREVEVDLVYTDHDFLTATGFRVGPVAKPGWSPELLGRLNYIGHLVAARAGLVRSCERAFVDESSGAQDWHFLLLATKHARRVVHVPLMLYHWRARPGSVAASPAAKPWAAARALEIRRACAEAEDPRITTAGDDFRSTRLVMRASAAPDLVAVDVGGASEELSAEYIGAVRCPPSALASTDARGIADHLDDIVHELRDDDLLLVTTTGRGSYRGELTVAAAYAVQQNIGAVWPFSDASHRRAYTIEHGADRGVLAPIRRARSAFSSYTGNVLTGPLDGLLTSARSVRAVGGFAAAHDRHARRDPSPNALGAAFGIDCIARGLRNVAVSNVSSSGPFGAVTLDDCPTTDVYV